jgi:hypothetical protein
MCFRQNETKPDPTKSRHHHLNIDLRTIKKNYSILWKFIRTNKGDFEMKRSHKSLQNPHQVQVWVKLYLNSNIKFKLFLNFRTVSIEQNWNEQHRFKLGWSLEGKERLSQISSSLVQQTIQVGRGKLTRWKASVGWTFKGRKEN